MPHAGQPGGTDEQALAPEGGPRSTEPHDPLQLHRRAGPVEMELVRLDLRRQGRLADLRFRRAETLGQRVEEESGAELDQAGPELLEGLVLADVDLGPAVDAAGVERLLQAHQADAGAAVAGQDGPLDRRGAAPAGQEREVEVDERQSLEHRRPDELAEGDDHAEIGAGADHVGDGVGDREPELQGGRLHRAGRAIAAAASPGVGPADDQHDLVAAVHQGPQRRHGQRR